MNSKIRYSVKYYVLKIVYGRPGAVLCKFCYSFSTYFFSYLYTLAFVSYKKPEKKNGNTHFLALEVTAFFWKMKKSRYNWEKPVNLTFFKECCSYVFHPLTAFIVFPWFKFIVWTIIPIFFPLLFLLDQSPQGRFCHLVHGQTNFFPMGDNSEILFSSTYFSYLGNSKNSFYGPEGSQ